LPFIFKVEPEVLACSVSDLERTNKKSLKVAGRDIFVVKAHGEFYALDSFCYRKFRFTRFHPSPA